MPCRKMGMRSGLGILAVAVLVGGCAGWLRGDGPREVYEMRGLRYRAMTRVVSTVPLRIRTRVEATNTGDREVEVHAITCAVYLRLHANAERIGLAVWDERSRVAFTLREAREEGCRETGRRVAVPPGRTKRLALTEVEPAVIGDVIATGRYYFTALVPIAGRTIELISGAALIGGEGERE